MNNVAIQDIREYLWSQIKLSGLLNENNYFADGFSQPFIPIIPAQQMPEFINLLPGRTFIIFISGIEFMNIIQDTIIVLTEGCFADIFS